MGGVTDPICNANEFDEVLPLSHRFPGLNWH